MRNHLRCRPALAVMERRRLRRRAIEPAGNETIVFRRGEQSHRQAEQVEAYNDQEEGDQEAIPSDYPRVVQTVRFVNTDVPQNIGTRNERVSKTKLHGRTNVSAENLTYRAEGIASWYGPDFHGRLTANGERYNMHGISAAHRDHRPPRSTGAARSWHKHNGRSGSAHFVVDALKQFQGHDVNLRCSGPGASAHQGVSIADPALGPVQVARGGPARLRSWHRCRGYSFPAMPGRWLVTRRVGRRRVP